MATLAAILGALLAGIALLMLSALRVIPEYERAVHFRLGRLTGAKGPGLILVLPILDRIVRTSLRTVALIVPDQELVTKDNVTVKVKGVTYSAVRDPIKAVMASRPTPPRCNCAPCPPCPRSPSRRTPPSCSPCPVRRSN